VAADVIVFCFFETSPSVVISLSVVGTTGVEESGNSVVAFDA
jgi:hypothetical protein